MDGKTIDIRLPDGSIGKLDLNTGRGDWEQNFANHPKSVGELKAERDEDSRTWAPRDALISLLREIDSGLTTPTDLVICYIERDPEDGGTKSRYLNATSDLPTALGLLNRIQFRLNTGGPA